MYDKRKNKKIIKEALKKWEKKWNEKERGGGKEMHAMEMYENIVKL